MTAVSHTLFIQRVGSTLLGAKDGINRIFSTSEIFKSGTISVYHNGRRLKRALSDIDMNGEFTETESGGPGTGFDSILLRFSPISRSVLIADYQL